MTGPSRLLAWSGAVCVVGGLGMGAHAQRLTETHAVIVSTRESLDDRTSILMRLPDRIDQLLAQLPSDKPLASGRLPAGWSMNQSGKQIRLSGPAVSDASFRVDGAPGTFGNYTGKDARLQFGLNGHLGPAVKVRIGQLPKVNLIHDLEGILIPPAQGSPGWPLLIGVSEDYRRGEWSLYGADLVVPLISADDVSGIEILRSSVPAQYGNAFGGVVNLLTTKPSPQPFITVYPTKGTFTNVKFLDQWGELTVDAPISFRTVPWPASPTCPLSSGGDPGESGLRLDGVSPFTFAGQAACVSGCFPDYALGYGLKLDGATELSPWGLSPTSAMIGIPNTTSPGQHTITSADGSSTVTLGVLTIEGSIDQNKLWTGQSTTMRLRVLGTDVATPFDVLNRTPGIIDIEGGVRQQVTTPGGPDNAVTRGVKGIHRGDFSILYSVNVRDYCGVAQGQ